MTTRPVVAVDRVMLLLSSIEIENFRGIRHGKVEGLTEVNVLIGRNHCGKTTLAEAICRAVGILAVRMPSGEVVAAIGKMFAADEILPMSGTDPI